MINPHSPVHHPNLHRFSHQAMATVFEVFIFHEDRVYSQQAAMEAFRLADVLEIELSRFVPNGDIGRINALPPGESARVGIHAFACMKRGLEIGLIILVVLLVILGLIIGFNKLKGSDEEESGEEKTYY